MVSFTIQTPRGERTIGDGYPPFIVAEMSANHCQSFQKAVEIIKAAALSGADAIKLQTYTPDTMTIDSDKEWFIVCGKDNPDSWKGKKLYDIYTEAFTPWEWHAQLKEIAEGLGLVFFSSPFDSSSVDFLEKLNVPLYKVASYEVTDIPLLKKIASTGKPVIMSIGFAYLHEVQEAITTLRNNGAKDIAILHCVTSYSNIPSFDSTNLNTMLDIKNRFNVVSGFSDNNGGIEIPLLAVMMGASIIEKHVVSDLNDNPLDGDFSVNPSEFKDLVDKIRRSERSRGKINYGIQSEPEEYNKRFRRSLFVVEDITEGERFSENNVRVIRPSYGLAPKYYEEILGAVASKDIERGTPLSWDLIQK